MCQRHRSSPTLIDTKVLCLLLSYKSAFSPKAGHYRGRWKSFSLLGKQSALRTDSFSALTPTITPAPTTEDFYSVRLFSLQHKLNEKNYQLSARTTTISLCIQDPVGSFPMSNTPILPSFFPFLFALL